VEGRIEVTDLTLSYRWKQFEKIIFKNLNLSIDTGAFLTVIGRNGSGKSSLIKLILGLIEPEKGSVKINGKSVKPGYPDGVRQGHIAYLSQQIEELFYADTVREELSYGQSFQVNEYQEILENLELADLLERSIETLSGGERQALALAQFMSQPAPILLLDEPSSYLDRHRSIILRQYLDGMHACGKTILHITQYPSELSWGTHVLDLDTSSPSVATV